MIRRTAALVLLFTAMPAFAQQDLKSRADTASGADKAKFAVEYAEQSAKAADKAFQEGKDAEGYAGLKEIVKYAKVASEASIQTGKHEKATEITLRKIAYQLAQVKNALPVDEQPQVQQTIDEVDKARSSLLEAMFDKKRGS